MVASHFLRKPPRKVFEKMYLFSQERGLQTQPEQSTVMMNGRVNTDVEEHVKLKLIETLIKFNFDC